MPGLDRHAKATLRRELQRAEEDRARLDVVISYLRKRLREDETPAPAEVTTTAARQTNGRTSGRITATDAAARVLAERGRPMKTPELLPEVQRLGAKMKNSDNLYRTLMNSPRFRKVGRGLWALTEWPDSHDSGGGPG